MSDFLNRIKAGDILVGDGAMGTQLFEHGLETGSCPEEYNLTHPDIIKSIAKAYLETGADIIQTNTFGGSPLKLSAYGLEDKTTELNKLAVEHVRNQVGDRAFISGSVGPSGKILKPYGDTDPDEMYESFKIQTTVLLNAGVDIFCVETMTDINEAVAAVKSIRDQDQSIPIMATMTFDQTTEGFFTIMGATIEQTVIVLTDAGADVVGSNCGNGIEKMVLIAEEFRKLTDMPLAIQSNAGLPEIKGREVVYPETPEFMADHAKKLINIGVQVIGGCCGTTPAHIKALREVVDSCKQ